MSQNRQPKGIPVGGQFSASAREEAARVNLLDAAPDADETDAMDESVAQPTSYSFPTWKTKAAIASIDKANRRAEKAGIPERFGYTTETWERTQTENGIERIVSMTTLTLDRPLVRHDGWEFAATLTWDAEAGLITRSAPGAELTERPKDRLCDVCGQQRERRDTYVVQRTNPETGKREQMQVGSNCLNRFMGIKPAGLFMLEFDVETSEGKEEPPDRFGHVEERYNTSQVLAIGLAVVEGHGWVSRTAANAYNAAGGAKTATADIVADVLRNRPKTEDEKREIATIQARATELRDAGAGDELLAEARDFEGEGDYAENMRAAAAPESVTTRNLGLILSAIGARQSRKEREVKNAALKTSKHIGVVKGKIEDVKVTVDSVRFFPNDFTGKTLISMRDTDGNVIKWWATGFHDEVDEGDKFTMKATVKDHEEYQGVAETTVTRAKLVERED